MLSTHSVEESELPACLLWSPMASWPLCATGSFHSFIHPVMQSIQASSSGTVSSAMDAP